MDKFPILNMLSKVYLTAGWFVIIGGGIYTITSFIPRQTMFGNSPDWLGIFFGIIIAIAGSLVLGLSEGISIFLAIEKNTRGNAATLNRPNDVKE